MIGLIFGLLTSRALIYVSILPNMRRDLSLNTLIKLLLFDKFEVVFNFSLAVTAL
jgi:hypothetical protein